MKTAVIIFNPITKNLKDIINSINKYLLTESKDNTNDVFVTSKDSIGFGEKIITRFNTYPKTTNTMKFKCITDNYELLKVYDNVVCLNGACVLVNIISSDIFNEGTFFVKHPGFQNKNREDFSYEKNKESSAYVSSHEGSSYFYDYFMGGKTQEFVGACKRINNYAKQDQIKDVTATWYDESYLNRYLINNTDFKVLGYEHCWADLFKKPKDTGDLKVLVKTFKADEVPVYTPKPKKKSKPYKPSKPVKASPQEIKDTAKLRPKKKKIIPPRPKAIILNKDEQLELSASEKYSPNVVKKLGVVDLTDTTFIIPVKLDSRARKENLDLTIDYILSNFNTNIIVGEESIRPMFGYLKKVVTYMHVKPTLNCFHRTKMLNLMTKMATTKYVANYDCDVLMEPSEYLNAVQLLRTDACDFVYPYNGHFILTPRDYINVIRKDKDVVNINLDACNYIKAVSRGGAIIFNKKKFVEAGMENEWFRSWGPEDTERYIRFKKLGYRVQYLTKPLYHIEHPRGADSGRTNLYFGQNETEFRKINRMTVMQLRNYIKTWHWITR